MEWSISIAEQEEVQECGDVIFLTVMVYSRASTFTLALLQQVFDGVCGVLCLILLEMSTGRLSSAVIYFTLESEANEDPPEFTLTCQSRRGPVTEVEWWRNEVRVEEDSNHMTSQIIVDTSRNTVYNNTLRVRGREGGLYVCNMSNNRHEGAGPRATKRVESELNMANNEMSFTQISYQSLRNLQVSMLSTRHPPVFHWSGHSSLHSALTTAMWYTISLEMESVTVWPSLLTVGKTIHMN